MTHEDFNQMDAEALLTAYALGELEGEDKQSVERRLEEDAGLRGQLEQIQATAEMLRQEFQEEQTPQLTEAQRERIALHVDPPAQERIIEVKRRPMLLSGRFWAGSLMGAAACLLVVLNWPLLPTGERDLVAINGSKPVSIGGEEVGLDRKEFAQGTNERLGQLAGAPAEAVSTEGKGQRGAGNSVVVSGETGSVNTPILDPSVTQGAAYVFDGSSAMPDFRIEPSSEMIAPADEAKSEGENDAIVGGFAGGLFKTGEQVPPPPSSPMIVAPGKGSEVGYGEGSGGEADARSSVSHAMGGGRLSGPGGSFAAQSADRKKMGRNSREQTLILHSVTANNTLAFTDPIERRDVIRELLKNDVGRQRLLKGDIPELGVEFRPDFSREAYDPIVDNPFLRPTDNPLSTFSIDVDTASYSNVRRMINGGGVPPQDAVRIEEMLNYFSYAYEPPASDSDTPFAAHLEVNQAPWSPDHRLVKIGIKGKEVKVDERPATNLVFLIDVSGSMSPANKLPLLQQAFRMMVDRLNADDRVAIVVYAGAAGLVLPSTYCNDPDFIKRAISNLRSGGSTAGGAGIELAYKTAMDHYIEGGVNRVVLATDGDFNVGVSDDGSLVRLIEEKRETGVFLSVLGFGTGNFQDAKMEKLSNAGNGNFAYIDTMKEAKKVLVDQLAGTLVTIAKDVKIQVEFNPRKVGAYRLIGYENRVLAAEDFNNDTIDAGEIGAGHTVTALYEIVPVGAPVEVPVVDELKYQKPAPAVVESDELLTLKIRYKEPEGETSTKIEFPLLDAGTQLNDASVDYRFAAAVAEFGMILRGSPYKGTASFSSVLDLAEAGLGGDEHGYRAEFAGLVRRLAEKATPQAEPESSPPISPSSLPSTPEE